MLTIWGCEVIKNRLFTSSKLSPLRTSAMSCAPLTIPCSRQILLSPSVYLVHSVPDGMFLIYFPMQKNWSTKAFGEKESNRSGDRKQNLCASKDDFPSFLWGRANNWPTSPTAVCFWRCRGVAPPCLDGRWRRGGKGSGELWMRSGGSEASSSVAQYAVCSAPWQLFSGSGCEEANAAVGPGEQTAVKTWRKKEKPISEKFGVEMTRLLA